MVDMTRASLVNAVVAKTNLRPLYIQNNAQDTSVSQDSLRGGLKPSRWNLYPGYREDEVPHRHRRLRQTAAQCKNVVILPDRADVCY